LFSIDLVGHRLARRLDRSFRQRAAGLEAERLAGQALQRRERPGSGPHLEFGIADRPQLQQIVFATVMELEAANRLRVTAVEALGQPQHRRQCPNRTAQPPREMAEPVVLPLRRRLSMIARDERDRLDLVGLEAAQVAVGDQVVRVLVVPFVADVDADVVQNRGVLQPFALAIGEPVDRARLIEQRQREPGDVIRMLRPVVAALGELEDAASPHVGIAIGLDDLFPVP